MKISLYAALILLFMIAMPAQKTIKEHLKETDGVQEYCIKIIAKYERKIKKYEERSQKLAENIQADDNGNDKRKLLLVHTKLTWYIKQLAVEKEYCGLTEDEQLEIDTGGDNEISNSRGAASTVDSL